MNDPIFFDYFAHPSKPISCYSEEDEEDLECDCLPFLLHMNGSLQPVMLHTILTDTLIAGEPTL